MATDPGLRRLALRTLLAAFPGTSPPEWASSLLADGLAGYTLFGGNVSADPHQLAALTAELRAVRPDVLLAIDEEGGDVTRLAHHTGSPYPGNAALGVVDDPALTRQIYQEIGDQLAAAGINVDLAPVVDVNTADDNPIIGTRSFGADPAKVATHSAAAVTGLQRSRVAACAKHFPGHGATLTDSHLTLPTVDEPLAGLRSRDLPPFAAAIEAGAQAVMTAHIRVPSLTGEDPATFSAAALTTLLRGELGFTGAVVTDALEMIGAVTAAGDVPSAAVRSLAAGSDLLCLGGLVDAPLVERVAAAIAAAIAGGELPAQRVEQAAGRGAALARWAAAPSPVAPAAAPSALGYEIAGRAIQVDGDLADLADPVPVQLDTGTNLAEGAVPWGLAGLIPDLVRLDPAETSPAVLGRIAGDRPLVLVGRHLHRSAGTRALVEKLAPDHRTVVVEMGWPSRWRPSGARAFVTTRSASRAAGTAVARLLGLHLQGT